MVLPFWVSLVEDSWVEIQKVSLVLRWKTWLDGTLELLETSSLQQGRLR